MTLDDVVAEHYRDFIRMDDILHSIAEKYQCSLEQAMLVLEDVLAPLGGHGALRLYGAGALRPRELPPQNASEIWNMLRRRLKEKCIDSDSRTGYQMLLFRQDEIRHILAEANIPLDEAPSGSQGRNAHSSKQDTKHDLSPLELKARLMEAERQLAEARADNGRLAARCPLPDDIWLTMAIDVQHEFWGHAYEAMDRSDRPPQTEIVNWVMNKYDISETRAKEVERMACTLRHRK